MSVADGYAALFIVLTAVLVIAAWIGLRPRRTP